MSYAHGRYDLTEPQPEGAQSGILHADMESTDAFEIAKEAVERLRASLGGAARFPFDRLWEFAESDVPPLQRPSTARKLTAAGYIEPTGHMTVAVTEDRKGSPTREYRLGPLFRPTPAAAPTTVGTLLTSMREQMGAEGFIVSLEQLANFFVSLRAGPLVILAGPSGTGKSELPRRFARLTKAVGSVIPVQPHWSDNSDLLGYTPTLAPEVFVSGRVTEAIVEANANPRALQLVTLDEMNLAPVEHYFSDFLSVVESRRRENGLVVTDSLPLDLPPPGEGEDSHVNLRDLIIPRNFRLVGTANIDETVRPFSARVLDRAFTIEFAEVDLAAFASEDDGEEGIDFSPLIDLLTDPQAPINVTEALGEHRELFEAVAGQLVELKDLLAPANIDIAYRTRDAVCMYLHYVLTDDLVHVLPLDVAMDICILQKVLPRVGGHGETLRAVLTNLAAWLEDDRSSVPGPLPKHPYIRSAERTRQMLDTLELDGTTSFWR